MKVKSIYIAAACSPQHTSLEYADSLIKKQARTMMFMAEKRQTWHTQNNRKAVVPRNLSWGKRIKWTARNVQCKKYQMKT